MKTLKLLVIGTLLFFAGSVQAQISVQVNLGTPPQWGPSGYSDVQYYYLPDVEAYYDIPSSMFIYYNGVTWVHRSYLPSRYRNYDLYSGYKVVMTDYHGGTPYTHFREYKAKYHKGYRGEQQRSYGQRPERANSNVRESYKGHSNRDQGRGKIQNSNHGNDRNSKNNNDRGRVNGKNKRH